MTGSHVLSGRPLPDTPDAALLARVLPYTYIVVACPFCKVGPGVDCRTPNYSVALSVHAGRRKAAWQLDDMDRYRKFAQMRAEEASSRAKLEEMLARPLTPEQQATRAAVNDAFRRADEAFHTKERAMYARCRDPWIHNEQCRCHEGRPYVAPAPKPRVMADVADLAAVRARKAVRA